MDRKEKKTESYLDKVNEANRVIDNLPEHNYNHANMINDLLSSGGSLSDCIKTMKDCEQGPCGSAEKEFLARWFIAATRALGFAVSSALPEHRPMCLAVLHRRAFNAYMLAMNGTESAPDFGYVAVALMRVVDKYIPTMTGSEFNDYCLSFRSYGGDKNNLALYTHLMAVQGRDVVLPGTKNED